MGVDCIQSSDELSTRKECAFSEIFQRFAPADLALSPVRRRRKMTEVTIRALQPGDAETVAELSISLGYPAKAGELRLRMEALAGSNDRIALAATLHDVVVGWIEAAIERHLQSEPVVVIGGLIVRDDMRGKRIGQQLCQAVEQWAEQIGIARVRVRSQTKRVDAHRFYMREGYEQVKVSAVFEKNVLPQE
jgi:GNAT superfamily N-acetyltransferase